MTRYESYSRGRRPHPGEATGRHHVPFTIEVRFLGGLTEQQRAAFPRPPTAGRR